MTDQTHSPDTLSTPYGDFARLLNLLGRYGPGERIRIAHQKPGGQFGQVPLSVEEAWRVLPMFDGTENLWFEINESSYQEPAGRSSEQHITRLTCVWADIDYKGDNGPGKRSGMGSEGEALRLVDELSRIVGVPPAAIVYSGNGVQPYWIVENGDIDDGNKEAVKLMLRRWGVLVRQTAISLGGDVDSIFDFPRILRIPGPPNMKNPAEPKPTRAEFPEGSQPFDVQELVEILDEYAIYYTDEVTVGLEPVSLIDSWEWAEQDCSFVGSLRADIADAMPNARHPWALKVAAILHGMIRYGCITEQSFNELTEQFSERFVHLCTNVQPVRPVAPGEIPQIWKWGRQRAEAWTEPKLIDEMRGHLHFAEQPVAPVVPPVAELPPFPQASPQAVQNDAPDAGIPAGLQQILDTMTSTPPAAPASNVTSIFTGEQLPFTLDAPSSDGNLALELKTATRLSRAAFTDTGNAERLAIAFAGRYIFVPGIGYMVWSSGRYVRDESDSHKEVAKDVFMSLASTAANETAEKWAISSLNQARLNAAANMAASIPSVVTTLMQMDADPYELCTPGGVAELRTGTLRKPNPVKDRHTKQTRFAPNWETEAPQFMRFLRWALETDEMIAYVQRLFGMACVGELLGHVFPIFLGKGGNGKTTLLWMIGEVMGDYAITLNPKFLIEKRGEQHPTELAQLQGVRMAFASEVPSKSAFDEELVKMIAGEPELRARFIAKDFITFKNMVTMFLAANHLPRVRYGGRGWWRRVRNILFRGKITGPEDAGLPQRIVATEGAAIMAWLLDGAKDYLQHGENPPADVLQASAEYEREEDSILRFVEQGFEFREGLTYPRSAMYAAYEMWARKQNIEVMSQVQFGREITTRYDDAGGADEELFYGIIPKVTIPVATDGQVPAWAVFPDGER